MDVNDFTSYLVNELTEKVRHATEKLLMQDIIMIYNGCYNSYDDYYTTMISGNNRLIEIENKGMSFSIHPKHTILDKDIYLFIKELKGLYK